MKCPNCQETLVIGGRSGIEIDYCPKCRGVWLDRGELDKIIERYSSTQPENTGKEKYYDDDDYKYRQEGQKGQHPRKKRGGFLGDLFDFD